MHIMKVDHRLGGFRVVIPYQIILRRMWSDVEYVLIEDVDPETITIRRVTNGKATETVREGRRP